jgi:biofilm PGA synthesis N-glycosyltransferase PgaC
MTLEVLFWLLAVGVAYSYVGYPLLLLILARIRPAPPVTRAPITPRLSVVVAAHNEEAAIEARIRNLLDSDYPADLLEVIVASDGSDDGTDEKVRGVGDPRVRLVRLDGPRGKPNALNHAVPQCRGEIVVLADARQRFAPDALKELAACFADPAVGAVSGELHIEAPEGSPEGVGFYWRYEKLIRRAESRLGSVVGATGAIYAIRRELFRPLDPATILDDVSLPLTVANAGYRVLFEPRARAFDRLSDRAGQEFRRKVRTLAGNFQLVALRPELLIPGRSRLLWQFVSHKLTRLAVPWCLLGMLATSGILAAAGPRPWLYGALLAAQSAFYALATAAATLGGNGRRVRLLSVPYAVVMLNLAAASALFGFARRTQKVAWRSA